MKVKLNNNVNECPLNTAVLVKTNATDENWVYQMKFTDDRLVFWDVYNTEKDSSCGFMNADDIIGWVKLS